MVIIISKLRDKFLLYTRLFLTVAILIILIGQLCGIIKASVQGGLLKNTIPAGKVIQVLEDKQRETVSDGLLEKLKGYYRGK